MGKQLVKEKSVIIRSIIATVLVSMFFVGIVIAYFNMMNEEKRANIIKDGQMSGMQASSRFDKYLSTNVDSIKLTAYTLNGMISEGRSDEEIQDYLVGQSTAVKNAVSENLTGIYAYINGKFFSGTNWIPPEGYEPTERPWYKKPMTDIGNITLLDPYIDVQSGNVMLALGTTLCDNVSVVSVDLSLDEIQRITEDIVRSGDSDIEMILNAGGIVVAHSDAGENGKNYNKEEDSLGSAILKHINNTDDNFFELNYGNYHYVVYSENIRDGWHCISVKDATAVLRPLGLIFALTVVAVIIMVAILSAIMITSGNRQLTAEKLNTQISATADIYISLHEIDLRSNKFSVVRNNDSRSAELFKKLHGDCQDIINTIMEQGSDPSSRDIIIDFVDLSKIDHRLKDRNTMTCEFLSPDKKWCRARFIASAREPSGKIARVLFLVENINAERRERDMTLEAVKLMNEQISSVANIYFSMHDIDLLNDTFTEITTKMRAVSDLVSNKTEHAQLTMYTVMDRMTSESSKAAIHDFLDFSTLDERLKDATTITEEFLSNKDVWSRARFVVSKRLPDGRISHVLWLVEGIDAEKRRRDTLAEAAETLNYRISSIANIYMTAHEMDIKNDTFTEIKSQSEMVNNIIGESRTNAQATLYKVMEGVCDPSYVDDVLEFADMSTLDKRLADVDTITIEYMNINKQWRRGRFVASRRSVSGEITHVLWLSEDIDNEIRERDKLIDMSQRAIAASEAKSLFLSKMSHSVRTPINSMLNMNEMILRECDDDNILSYSENIRTSGNTLLGLVNDILDISKIEAGKMRIEPVEYETVPMINELSQMISRDADEKGLTLTLNISPGLPGKLYGDELHIKQIIMNLLTNAVKYTRSGMITFSMDCEPVPDEPDSIYIDVSVKDTGIGLKPDELKKLLSDSTHEHDNEGKGLGIDIIKSLLGLMGSSLNVTSIYDLGSKFSFRLKQGIADAAPVGDYEKARTAAVEAHRKYHEKFKAPDAHILVADDVAINLAVFGKLLSRTEVIIDVAPGGKEALELSHSHKYDIIFLDHIMPGKNGLETLRDIRADKKGPNRETPVICLTADAVSGAREQYIAAGYTDYMTKPIEPEVLEDMLLRYLPKDLIR